MTQRKPAVWTMTASPFERARDAAFARYGVAVEHRFVEVAAITGRAHVSVCGEGPPVLMVIGGGGPGALWAPLMAELHGYTLYAVDRPGFGLTTSIRHTTAGLREQSVGFLEGVLDGLGLPRAAVVSNSMGSLWSSWLAIDSPARVGPMVQIGCTATILGTSAPTAMRMIAVRGLGNAMMKLEPPGTRQTLRLMKRLGDPVDDAPEINDLMLACQRLPSYAPAWLSLLHAALRLTGARPEVELGADELRRITQPVQLMWSRNDPFAGPDIARRAAETLPLAELHVVDGGHLPWLSHASVVGDLARRFLDTHVRAISEPATGPS